MLKIETDDSPARFLERAGPRLYDDEAANSLMLGLATMLLKPPADEPTPGLWRVVEDGVTVTAAVQTPPHNLVLTFANPAQLDMLAEHLMKVRAQFPGVVGPATEAESFANAWSKYTGARVRLGIGQKVYRAEAIVPPVNVRGEARMAEKSDFELVTRWLREFIDECLPPHEQKTDEELRKIATAKIAKNQVCLWMVDDQPVSTAHSSRPTKNGITVNAVYTPRERRGHGYASAVTAALSQRLLDGGRRFCALYTDLANPTSNKIYQNIGYREICDSRNYLFEDQA